MNINLSLPKLSKCKAVLFVLILPIIMCCFAEQIHAQLVSVNPTTSPCQFVWDNNSGYFLYEIQVLRLYNIDSSFKSQDTIKANINWDEATNHYVNQGESDPVLHRFVLDYFSVMEGTGYYAWRVRPLYNRDYIGRTDHNTWGGWLSWSGSNYILKQDTTIVINPSVDAPQVDIFWYNQPDNDKNWIYRRQFGNNQMWLWLKSQLGERVDYANSLLMPTQHQSMIYYNWSAESQYPLISETVIDNSGRSSLQSLQAPVTGRDGIGYKPKWLQNNSGGKYIADDFDNNTNYNNPSVATGAVADYYSSSNIDKRIPSAEGKPFGRTLYYNDPLNREREISTPGAAHAPDPAHNTNSSTAHTIRKFYGKAADNELTQIFGDEAPSDSTVYKTYTVDPNGTINITYTDHFNHTIATCITEPGSSLLENSPSTNDPNCGTDRPALSDTVTNRVKVSDTRFVAKASYVFAVPTQLNYLYELSARSYGDLCVNLCATCDYRITISARERDDTTTYRLVSDAVPVIDYGSPTCSTVKLTRTGAYDVGGTTLAPGTYDVSVTLDLKVADPVTGKLYIDSVANIMHRKLDTAYALGGYVLPVTGGSTIKYLDSMEYYATTGDWEQLSDYLEADTSKSEFQFSLNHDCDVITLPTVRCEKMSCDSIYFAEYMRQKLIDDDIKSGTSFFSNAYANVGANGIAFTTDTLNLFLLDSNAEFNSIIRRMVLDGYDCSVLWDAWVQIVPKYISGQKSLVPNGTTILTSSMRKYDWWQEFMKLVGYKFPFTARPYGGLFVKTDLIRRKPYRYFPYDWGSDTTSENIFCYMEFSSLPCPSPTWADSINNFPVSDPTTESYHMYNFYKKIKGNGPSNAYYYYQAQINSVNRANVQNKSQQMADFKTKCYSACDGRLGGLVASINRHYMDQWSIKVEGERYDPWLPSPVDSIPITQSYCLAYAIVDTCKKLCDVTPDSSGYMSSGKINNVIKATTSNIEVYTRPSVGDPGCLSGYDSVVLVNTPHKNNLLHWLNYQNDRLIDSLKKAGASYYNWPVLSNIYSFASSPVNAPPCSNAMLAMNTQLTNPAVLSFFSYGRRLWHTPSHVGTDISLYRLMYDSVVYGSETPVQLYLRLTDSLATNDSIVVYGDVPSGFTYITGDGPLVSGRMRYSLLGPKAMGDSIPIVYYLKAPSTSTDVNIEARAHKYTGAVIVDSTNILDYKISARQCLALRYNKVVKTTWSSWVPTDTIICDNVCSSLDICSGKVCIRWSTPALDNPDTTLRFRTCGQLVAQNFLQRLKTAMLALYNNHEKALRQKYQDSCLSKHKINDMFVNSYCQPAQHFTLYHYDRAGNLVRTTAPQGMPNGEAFGASRLTSMAKQYHNEYDYDTKGQLLRQKTTDGGETWYIYDKLGRVRFSQNAKQSPAGKYSYTKYDDLDRVVETGEYYAGSTPIVQADADDGSLPAPSSSCTNRNVYVYDEPVSSTLFPAAGGPILPNNDYQANITNRLSYSISDQDGSLSSTGDQTLVVYSYDPHGNVELLYQSVSGLPPKLIRYTNDVFGQLPEEVDLLEKNGQPNLDESFSLFYYYSQNSRPRQVFAYPNDGSFAPWRSWTHPALGAFGANDKYIVGGYMYSPHSLSEVRRVEYGVTQQGLDYTYTLEGWLKAINHPDTMQDPGIDLPTTWGTEPFTDRRDGVASVGASARTDAFSEVLHYYDGDFIHTGSQFHAPGNNMFLQGTDLFNGNISAVQTRTPAIPGSNAYHEGELTGFKYTYDQLNRLRSTQYHIYDPGTTTWNYNNPGEFDEQFGYDRNGNFTALKRYGYDNSTTPGTLKVLEGGEPQAFNYQSSTNKLIQFIDTKHPTTLEGGQQGMSDLSDTIDYSHDAIGNLTHHQNNIATGPDAENLDVLWNPYGKIARIVDNAHNVTTDYLYDALGNRVKQSITDGSTGIIDDTYYLHTADGKVLAIYEDPGAAGAPTIKERHLYGLDRLGIMYGKNKVTPMHTIDSLPVIHYEVKDHLGNVRVVVKDDNQTPGLNIPTIASYSNYYAYGSPMRDRTVNSLGYRYGFNGQEKDDHIMGAGNLNTAKFWEYDTRLGRRWNIDPVDKPWRSTYSVLENTPIWRVDPNGDDDFFNSQGMFIRSTKKGTAIRIVGVDGISKLSDINFNKVKDLTDLIKKLRIVSNVGTYYAHQINLNYVIGVDKNPIALAHTNRTNVSLTTQQNGCLSTDLDDYRILKNVLVHEDGHKKNYERTSSDEITYYNHWTVYFDQIAHKTFHDLDKQNQLGFIISGLQYLFNSAIKESNGPGALYNQDIENLNQVLSKEGISISLEDPKDVRKGGVIHVGNGTIKVKYENKKSSL